MKIGVRIKQVRTAKGLSQKQVALALQMDQAQFSRIESGRTDPAFSVIEKIAQALGVALEQLIQAEGNLRPVDAYEQSLVEKLQLLETLPEEERKTVFAIVDAFVGKRKLKAALESVLQQAG